MSASKRGSCASQRGSCASQRGICASHRGICASQRGICKICKRFCAPPLRGHLATLCDSLLPNVCLPSHWGNTGAVSKGSLETMEQMHSCPTSFTTFRMHLIQVIGEISLAVQTIAAAITCGVFFRMVKKLQLPLLRGVGRSQLFNRDLSKKVSTLDREAQILVLLQLILAPNMSRMQLSPVPSHFLKPSRMS